MKFHFIADLKEKAYALQKKKGGIKKITLGLALVMLLSGCGAQKGNDVSAENSQTPNQYHSQVDQQGDLSNGATSTTDSSTEDTNTEDTAMTDSEKIAELQRRIDALENASTNTFASFTANDTFTQAEWDAFVVECKNAFVGKINNVDEEGMKAAFIIFNIDYLEDNAKQVLLNHYSQGQDVEAELNNIYAVLSQVREHNTELTNADDYLSYTAAIKDEQDKAILTVLDNYAKEVITLKQDLNDTNRQRIQEIFDIIDAFSRGEGTIKVTINGEVKEFAQANLSHGGIFAAENIAQDISVLSRNIVSQEKREDLDKLLNSRNTLAKTQETIIKYTAISSINAPGINEEEQTKVVNTFNYYLDVISGELAAMDITREETQALLMITNIEYFMDSANSQNAFGIIYKDGFDINGTFEKAEEAVRKIQAYDDTHDVVYNMSRLVMNSEGDLLALKAFSQFAHGITSTDATVVQSTANTIKGFSQYSKDVTIDYEITRADGTTETCKIDKNGLTSGAKQVINWYTYYSVSNHKTAYGATADAILPLVDGSEYGLDPYESIVLMVEDKCADNNIVIYNYNMGGNTK